MYPRQMDPNNKSLREWASLFKPLYNKTFHWTSWSADPDCLDFEKKNNNNNTGGKVGSAHY